MADSSLFDVDAKWKNVGDMWIPSEYFPEKTLEAAENFKFRESDILIVSYPKTGNTHYSFISRPFTKSKKLRNVSISM